MKFINKINQKRKESLVFHKDVQIFLLILTINRITVEILIQVIVNIVIQIIKI
jgi:hypothetical protein